MTQRDAILELADDECVDLGDLARSPGFLLRIAQIAAFESFFAHNASLGLKPGEFTVLLVVSLNPGLKQGTIAKTLHIKPAHMTKLVGRLVADGLVERHTPPDDRRAVRLMLTTKGATLVNTNQSAMIDAELIERTGLTSEESATLITLLKKLSGLTEYAHER